MFRGHQERGIVDNVIFEALRDSGKTGAGEIERKLAVK
jgi:hypothetical protein